MIDPNDTRGHKNHYIAQLRDQVILSALPQENIQLLDFGCGSGNLSRSLASEQRKITGIDISPELLDLARKQNDVHHSRFVLYDGAALPFPDQSFDVAVSYVVLNHIVDDSRLTDTIREIRRVLKDSGRLICIEQTRRKTLLTYNGIKKQRSIVDFSSIFAAAGFAIDEVRNVRKARYVPIYLIRYGLVPRGLFQLLARIDGMLANLFPAPRYSYVDTLFTMKKSTL